MMKSTELCLHFICIFIQIPIIIGHQLVGDFCALSAGSSGQCQLVKDCPLVIQDLSEGKHPDICGFEGSDSIVCCPNPNPVSSSTTIKTSTSTRNTEGTTSTKPKPTEPVAPQVGDKSRAKCIEYDEVVVGGLECAFRYVPLIVGGRNAKAKEFPHMALIGFEDEDYQPSWQCDGSLISDQFVLTAAHCLNSKQYGVPKYVRIGDLVTNDESDDAKPQDFTISEMHKHPDYKVPSRYHDIALLKLDREASLNAYVRPACLETSPTVDFTRKPVASGWARTDFTSDISEELVKVTLEYFTHSECYSSYRYGSYRRLKNAIDDATQICAGSSQSIDTCDGHSTGGPLQIVNLERNCMYTIVGVSSFGNSCSFNNIPGVYTRVSRYIDWIEKIVWP